VRVTGCGGVGFRFQTVKLAIAAPNSKAPTLRISARRPSVRIPFAAAVGADVTCESPSAIHFNSSQRSLATCHLFSGSLARHFFATRSRAGGVIGWSDDIGEGLEEMMAEITLA
jgi:hypothetical protein